MRSTAPDQPRRGRALLLLGMSLLAIYVAGYRCLRDYSAQEARIVLPESDLSHALVHLYRPMAVLRGETWMVMRCGPADDIVFGERELPHF